MPQNRGPYPVSESDQYVREQVEKLRLRLLDLTTRNPLISFKHAARARRYVRVVDELPNQLYSKLAGDSGMRFRSLGRQSSEPDDEKTILFRRAVDAAKLEDTEYLEKRTALGDDPGDRALDRLEQELRERLRERLGMPPRRRGVEVSAADVARQQGLDPSFDLPVSSQEGAVPGRHADGAIQTLLFEDDMQLTLGRMREAVRLSIEEAGVNPLFCVFGFLEWYEDGNSETPLHAPLLLCPLNIDRKLVRGQYQYAVQATGEDIQVNVAVGERLKRDFEIVLPPFEEDDTPEAYFTKVQKVIERQKSWKLRRWISVGLFSFARIAMYHDLAPDRWAPLGGLERHEGLNRLIAGGGGGTATTDEFTGGIEQGDGELEVPLISDADSSQLGALKDVLSGRNLVIEGPPGTGKSQTITNMIAASLAAGKTVLFLAEKMAALNVVRDRLVQAGLDDFCLELHSTKAGRKGSVQALARRLERRPNPKMEFDLQATLGRLQTLRDALGRCVEALAQPVGQLGITAQELLWRCNAVREQTPSLPSEIDEILLSGAEALTEIDVGRIASTAKQFENARTAIVKTYGSVRQHPWRGVAKHDIDPIRAEDIVRRVRRLAEASKHAASVLKQVEALTNVRLEKIGELKALLGAGSIPEPDVTVSDDVIARMADPQTLATMEQFAADLSKHRTLREEIRHSFAADGPAVSASPTEVRAIADGAANAGIGDVRVAHLPALAEKRHQQAAAWSAVAHLMGRIVAQAGWSASISPKIERALVGAVELAAAADDEIVVHRNASTVAVGATTTLRQAHSRAGPLRQQRDALAARFELASIEPQALRKHALALRSAPFLPFMSPAWWRAKRAFRGLCKGPLKLRGSEIAKRLDEMAAFHEANVQFGANDAVTQCIGGTATTIDSDLGPSLRTSEWADRVRAALPAGDEVNVHLRQLLFNGTPDQLEGVAAFENDPQFANLRKVVSDQNRLKTIEAHASLVANSAARLDQLMAGSNQLSLQPEVRLTDCAGLAQRLQQSQELREGLDTSVAAGTTLGDRFKGHETDPKPILACASHVRAVEAASLPVSVKGWLSCSQARARLASLQPLVDQCRKAFAEVEATISELCGIAAIDFEPWIGIKSPFDTCAGELASHAERCASDPEGFQFLIEDARLLYELQQVGMQPMLDLLEARSLPLEQLDTACKRIIFQTLARNVIAQYPALANFTGDRHENWRREFRELDHRLKRFRQGSIANSLLRRPVDPGTNVGSRKLWTGLPLIQNEVAKQRGHIPLRDLLDRAGRAVQQLMPCFMMSPLSIAQFLKPGCLKFDLIIMDEASQLRREDAIGAIARGGQIIVVGDPKQLPPTNFFRGNDGALDDDETLTGADEQSILDQALTIMRPARRLKWHYRSRHASLIAFSNKEFYDNQLVVFPSPYHDHPDFGVKYVHVPEGQWRNRVNAPEAQRVAAAAIEYVKNHPDRSLGIVTLNQPQAELLSLEIDRLAAQHEEFEAWRQEREHSLEPFFVKNLENVQGDERDVIIISATYGRDEQGNLYQRWSPINNEGGQRRLNVLFTRAKCQTIVYSSIDPADIRTDENSAWGVRALKGYLKFAKDGLLDVATESGRSPESDFELAVADSLGRAGYEVVPQVGVVGYFIDLAVRHPKRPGEFVLGVECDGAMYHSSRSARDRDRLRQEVLERLKWRIHRIWSLDWYRNPRREMARLVDAVSVAVAADNEAPHIT